MAPSAGPGFVQKEPPGCLPSSAFISTRLEERSAKASKLPEIHHQVIFLGLNSESTSSCTLQQLRYSFWWWYCFPWGWCLIKRVLCPRKMDFAVWGMTNHRFPSGWPFSSLTRGTSPRISLCDSSQLCPPCALNQGIWPQMKFCTLALEGTLCVSYPPSGGQKTCCFSQPDVILIPFWCCRLGITTWGCDVTLLRTNPPGCWNIPLELQPASSCLRISYLAQCGDGFFC